MRTFDDAWDRQELPHGTVLTIGNFDALHRGHQALISRVVERASALDQLATLVTFEPHPATVLHGDSNPKRLTTPRQKERLLEDLGLDALVRIHFTREFSRLDAETFVRRFLVDGLGVREVHVGESFSFGRDREGNLSLLQSLGKEFGFLAEGMPELRNGGELISSSRIREAIAHGDVGKGRSLLGRPYAIEGEVVQGSGRGAELGWPTANLEVFNELVPKAGVYVGQARLGPENTYPAAVNIGVRPTVEGDRGAEVVEAHLLDFDRDCYGERIELAFLERLRDEKRFDGLAELREQIGRDVRATREYFPVRVRYH